MWGYPQFGCWWCEMRYWGDSVLRIPFEYCERCKGKMRLAQSAWKSWSKKVTESSAATVTPPLRPHQ